MIGAPETIRTSDLCLRRATLYPAELRAPIGLNRRNARQRQRPLILLVGWFVKAPAAKFGCSNRLGRASRSRAAGVPGFDRAITQLDGISIKGNRYIIRATRSGQTNFVLSETDGAFAFIDEHGM